jgi:hypothetical protein
VTKLLEASTNLFQAIFVNAITAPHNHSSVILMAKLIYFPPNFSGRAEFVKLVFEDKVMDICFFRSC